MVIEMSNNTIDAMMIQRLGEYKQKETGVHSTDHFLQRQQRVGGTARGVSPNIAHK